MLTPRGYSILRKLSLGSGVRVECPQVKCSWMQESGRVFTIKKTNHTHTNNKKHGRPHADNSWSWVMGSVLFLKFSSQRSHKNPSPATKIKIAPLTSTSGLYAPGREGGGKPVSRAATPASGPKGTFPGGFRGACVLRSFTRLKPARPEQSLLVQHVLEWTHLRWDPGSLVSGADPGRLLSL